MRRHSASEAFRVLPVDELEEEDLLYSGAQESASADPSLAVAASTTQPASAKQAGADDGTAKPESDGDRLLDDNSFNKRDDESSAAASGETRPPPHVLGAATTGSALAPPSAAPASADAAPIRPPLANRTVRAALGDCDAFLSHSWRDPGHLKYAVLRRWAEGFEVQHSRRPTVWLGELVRDAVGFHFC